MVLRAHYDSIKHPDVEKINHLLETYNWSDPKESLEWVKQATNFFILRKLKTNN